MSFLITCISLLVSSPSHSLAFTLPLSTPAVATRGTPLLFQQHPPPPLPPPSNSCSAHQYDDRRNALRRIAIITSSASSLATTTSTTVPTTAVANAITPQQASASYDKYAANYNTLDGGSIATSLGIDDARKQLLSQAYGNVLEIGVGTGLNLDSYYRLDDDAILTSLTFVDISEGMLSVAKAHAAEIIIQQQRQVSLLGKKEDPNSNSTAVQVLPSMKFVKADATSELISLFGLNAFDTVVDTFSLCVMGNEGARKCLREMTGVVKKGGTYHIMHCLC